MGALTLLWAGTTEEGLTLGGKVISSLFNVPPTLGAYTLYLQYLGNVTGLQTCVGWCYRWLWVRVRNASLQPSLNLYPWHGFDRSCSICQSVWLSHIQPHNTLGMVFFYHHLHHPSPILLPPAANCPHMPLPSPEGCGLTQSGDMAERTQGGTQQVGGPVGVLQEWAMTHGPFSLIPLSWTPTNASSTSHHVGCIDLTMQT